MTDYNQTRAYRLLRAVLLHPTVSVGTTTVARMLGSHRPPQLERLPVARRFSVAVPFSDCAVHFDPKGDDESTRYFWNGFKYEEAIPLMVRLARGARTFIDVGANIGLFSLVLGIVNPDLSVFALEPVPAISRRLATYIELNNLDNVHLRELAFGRHPGLLPIFVTSTDWLPTDSSLLATHRPNTGQPVNIEVTTLDTFVTQNNIEDLDLLKIDTEGTEFDVLRGGTETLRTHRPAVLCEILPDREPIAATYLLDLGYVAFHVTPGGLVHSDDPQGIMGEHFTLLNWLFVHEDNLPWLINRL